MNCEQARNLFDAYLDGELSAALETELHAHRLQCSSCRQALALLEVTGHVVASGADEPRLGVEFSDRLLACLEPELPRPHPVRTWTIRLAAPLAAAACLALLIGYLSRPQPRVAGTRDEPDTLPQIVNPAAAEAPPPGFDVAATTIQQSLERALKETQQSSDALVQFGQMTLLEMAETLEHEAKGDSADPSDAGDEIGEGLEVL